MRHIIIASFVVTVAGCAESAVGDGGDVADTGTGGATGTGGEIGSGGSGGEGPAGVAYVALDRGHETLANPDSVGGTFFAEFNPGLSTSTCVESQVGACTVRRCDDGVGQTGISAGEMTVETLEGSVAVPFYEDHGSYELRPMPATSVEPGQPARVRASGGTAPAFDLEIVPPPDLTVLAPSMEPGYAPIVRAEGLDVAWSGEGEGTVVARILVDDSGYWVNVECRADLSDGELYMPPEVLLELPATDVDTYVLGGFSLRTESARVETIDGWEVNVLSRNTFNTATVWSIE